MHIEFYIQALRRGSKSKETQGGHNIWKMYLIKFFY